MMQRYIYNTYVTLFALVVSLAITISCTDDYDTALTPEQETLLGRAVNFNASVADPFITRTSYDHNGVFNDDDIMVIYRQYYNSDTHAFDWSKEDFHTYYFRRRYASGSTNISLGRDWQVAYSEKNSKGNWISPYLVRYMGKYSPSGTPSGSERTLEKKIQTEADSITWENGKTLRYRAWSRSNQSNAFQNGSKSSYYPDFEISDWVNVSGPTNEIPLTLRHIGSRIFFSLKNNGNQLSWAEICTNPEDYKRKDNADNTVNDNADMTYPKTFTVNGENVTVQSAEEAAAKVKAVYDRMCMPAGVNLEDGSLRGMTKTAYEATSDFSHIEEWEWDDTKKANLVDFGSKDASYIANSVQRPVFTGTLNSRLHLITIPYDMSDGDTKGENLVLPPWTRFKIWLYDVNGGDKGSTDNKRESEYHIFSLDDMKKDGETAYPDGLKMRPGYSYEFVVGYRYNNLTITPGESISWVDQDAAITGDAADDTQEKITTGNYSWWKNAIKDAIPRGNEKYAPEFHITNEQQFVEFINLVNNPVNEYVRTHPIYRLVKEYSTITNPTNGTISKVPKTYGWSTVNDEKNANWVEKDVLESLGYIFYEHYYPADGDKAAYFVEDYLKGAYNFYDAGLSRPFTVCLDKDLDFKDMKIDAVGTSDNRFRGYFEGAPTKVVTLDADGNMTFTDSEDPRIAYTIIDAPVVHTIKNLNVEGGYLFGYVQDSAIRNLKLQSYHTVGVLNTATPSMDGDKVTGWGCHIVGVSVKANNKANNTVDKHYAIAKSLTGLSYVVGCIHEGDAIGALVGTADNMTMYGCMRTADNISEGALLGAYATSNQYLAPTVKRKPYSNKPTWSRFMCNYYNKDIREASTDANAIGNIEDDYSRWYYIRGCVSRILCAQNDNLVDKNVSLSSLTDQQVEEFYGLAPWKAMNYAIYKYNTDANYPGRNGHECRAHYQVGSTGYDHTYPQLVSGKPGDECDEWNVLKQPN